MSEIHFEVPDLYVKDYKNEFTGRHKNLLEALNTVEKEFATTSSCNLPETNVRNIRSSRSVPARRAQTKAFRGKESIFKTPEVPRIRKCIGPKSLIHATANTPRLGGKWIKYSLENISDADMTESANANAAFSFLQELRERKGAADREDQEMELDQNDSGAFKPTFKKPSNFSSKVNFQTTKKFLAEKRDVTSSGNKVTFNKPVERFQTSGRIDYGQEKRPKVTLNHLNNDEKE